MIVLYHESARGYVLYWSGIANGRIDLIDAIPCRSYNVFMFVPLLTALHVVTIVLWIGGVWIVLGLSLFAIFTGVWTGHGESF